jgi:hypothetical protein
VLAFLGKYTFPIYLLNSLVTGFLLACAQTWWSLDGWNFRIAAPIMFISGLLVPVFFYELIIKRVPVLNTIIRI